MDSLTLPAWPELVRGGTLLCLVDAPEAKCRVWEVDGESMSALALDEDTEAQFVCAPSCGGSMVEGFTVDLTDETSRCHVAWWCMANGHRHAAGLVGDDFWAVMRAIYGMPMTDEQIATLRDLALRLEGGGDV